LQVGKTGSADKKGTRQIEMAGAKST